MTRRTALGLVLVFAAVSCSAGASALVRRSPDPEGVPQRVAAGAFPTRWPIKHVVFIVKENRSFDNLFGTFPGANGVTVGMDRGAPRPLTPAVDSIPWDMQHDYGTSLASIDQGRMDGFDGSPIAHRFAYTQFQPEQLPNYWRWAQDYVLSDNFFASAQGPSFPNHLFTIAATSAGTHANPRQSPEDLKQTLAAGYAKTWGCDMQGGFLTVYDSEGNPEKVPPCFDIETEGDLLTAAGIPWSYYGATNTQDGYIWSAYSAIRRYRDNPAMWQRHIFPVDRIVPDIRRGLLPPVTWVTPRRQQSDHPEESICAGENWSTKVIDALMKSPQWKSTAIFLTWDDWGGFYDHVPPRQIDDFGLGIRVPLLVLSPYAKTGFIDHAEGEFSSVLRFIEDNWGLTQLTWRDRSATDLSYDFNFEQPPRPPDPLPLRTDCP